MKLLDYPTDLPLADVVVHAETWDQFDQACSWFISAGAPLEYRRPGEHFAKVPVQMKRGMASYLGDDGRVHPINATVGQNYGFIVECEEINVHYEVHSPEFIR